MPTNEQQLFEQLRQYDTPTICNALEIVSGSRRDSGFTRQTMIPALAELPAFIGRAKTATLRSIRRPGAGTTPARRMEYYRYAGQPGRVVVIEDLDNPPGLGAFWGEVHSTVHAALGVVGVITNGAVRDLDMLDKRLPILAAAVTPSHAFVDIEQMDITVNILGMTVAPDNIIHADRHGAVVIPDDELAQLPTALATITRREREILIAAQKDDFSLEKLADALRRMRDIH